MTMINLRGFRRALCGAVGQPMAYQVRDGYGATLVPLLERIMRRERVHDDEILSEFNHAPPGDERQAELAAQAAALGPMIFPAAGRGGKATALISLRGVALYDLELQPYAFSTLLLAQSVNALARDPEVGAVILNIDSPGGVITGVPEAADAIWAARRAGTHVTALVNPLAASAAYWIASQANEVVAVPSGETGSIGVFILHSECSGMLEQAGVKAKYIFAGEHKVEGNPIEPLSEEAEEEFQSRVDFTNRQFVKAVARGRETTMANVERTFGQGRTFFSTGALRVGMIDRIATLDKALSKAGVAGDPQVFRAEGAANDGAGTGIEEAPAEKIEGGPGEVEGYLGRDWKALEPATASVGGQAPVPDSEQVLAPRSLNLASMTHPDGTKDIFLAEDEWPACILVTHELIAALPGEDYPGVNYWEEAPGGVATMSFVLANGSAVYDLISAAPTYSTFRLRSGVITPPGESVPEPGPSMSSRARRLAILRAG
jgi:signal peptide peptidase SppA